MLFTFLVPLLFLFSLFLSSQTQTIAGFGNLWLGILGLLGCFVGLFIWGWGFLSLGSSFSVLPKAKKLKTHGVYRYFRHPIYFGVALSCLGISLGLGSLVGLIYTILVVIPLNMIRATKEEKVLIAKFGKEYLNYKQKTIF